MYEWYLAVVASMVVGGVLAWLVTRSAPDTRREGIERRKRAHHALRQATKEWLHLIRDERWEEALVYADTVEQLPFGAASSLRWILANNRAWCCVELGRAEDAVVHAERAASLVLDKDRAIGLSTLGAAYQVAGRSAEAARLLEEALQVAGEDADSQATNAFYLGQSLRALGRLDEARAAYQRAVDESAEFRYGRRAKQQLGALSTAPHR